MAARHPTAIIGLARFTSIAKVERATSTLHSSRFYLCRQSEGDVVIDHDYDLEALAVSGDQAFESLLGQDCRSSLVGRVVDALLENEELALGFDSAFVGQS